MSRLWALAVLEIGAGAFWQHSRLMIESSGPWQQMGFHTQPWFWWKKALPEGKCVLLIRRGLFQSRLAMQHCAWWCLVVGTQGCTQLVVIPLSVYPVWDSWSPRKGCCICTLHKDALWAQPGPGRQKSWTDQLQNAHWTTTTSGERLWAYKT